MVVLPLPEICLASEEVLEQVPTMVATAPARLCPGTGMTLHPTVMYFPCSWPPKIQCQAVV